MKNFFLMRGTKYKSISEGKDEHKKGLLHMKMAEGAKLQMCYLLHHLNDIQLRHRVESIIAFSHDFVGDLQSDQLRRYIEIKQSDLPSAVAAKKTREFRCPPREQMNAILSFKNMDFEEDPENIPCGEDLIGRMNEFHNNLMSYVSLHALQEAADALEELTEEVQKPGAIKRLFNFINAVKELEEEPKPEPEPERKTPEGWNLSSCLSSIHLPMIDLSSTFDYRGISQGPDKNHRQLGRGVADRDAKVGSRNVQFTGSPIRHRGRANSGTGEDLRDQQQDQGRRCSDVGRSQPDPCLAARANVAGGGGTGSRTTVEVGQQSHLLPASGLDQSAENSRERDGDHDEHAGQAGAGTVGRSNAASNNRRGTSIQRERHISRNGGCVLQVPLLFLSNLQAESEGHVRSLRLPVREQ